MNSLSSPVSCFKALLHQALVCTWVDSNRTASWLTVAVCLLSALQPLLAQPVITSFSPTSGPAGTHVTITGTNFDPARERNTVYFGAVKGVVSAATASALVVTVPAGASHQPLSVTANNLTAYSSQPFTITFPGGGPLSTSSFMGPVDLAGHAPRCLRAADIDGDGKTDLVYINSQYTSLVILRNTGNGGPLSFAPGVSAAVHFSFSLEAADVDGDGKLDLIAPNAWNNSVTILRNTSVPGTVSFAPELVLATGDFPYSVAVKNLDDDGRPDLAVVNMRGRTVSVYKNLSTGGYLSFGPKTDYPVGVEARDVAAEDLDGDGKTDLAVTSQSNRYTSLLRNTSTGNTILFAPKHDIACPDGSAPEKVAATDLDGDGKSDLVVTNNNEVGTVSVFRNQSAAGSFSFAPRLDIATGAGTYPYDLAVADLNGDGKADLVVKNQFTATLSLLGNTGTSGSLSFSPGAVYATGSTEREFITAGDFNGDGKTDLAVGNAAQGKLSIYLNKVDPPVIHSYSPGSGPVGTSVTITGAHFSYTPSQNLVYFGATQATVLSASATTLTVVVPPGSTYQPITVTTRGLTAFAPSPFVVTFGSNCTTAPPRYTPATTLNTGSYPRHVLASDIDGDGNPDLVVTNHQASSFSVVLNTGGSGTVSLAAPADFTHAAQPFASAAGDLNGDGKPEVVTSSYPGNSLFVFTNASAPGTVAFLPKTELPAGQNPIHMTLADMDKDGKPDIVVVNNNGNSVSVFRNTTNGAISFAPKSDLAVGQWPVNAFVADFDGDGYSDIACVNNGDHTVSVLRNTSGPSGLSFAPKKDFSAGQAPSWVTAGDLDGDGKPELITANSASGTLSVFANNGTPGTLSFAAPLPLTTGSTPVNAGVADINGNGKPDLVVVNMHSNNVSVISNNSSAGKLAFDPAVNFATGSSPRAVVIADLDRDGKPELSITNSSDNTLSVLSNTTDVLQVAATATPVICTNNNGTIEATAKGGSPPYEYSINGLPYQSSNRFTGLMSGPHTVRVKDAGGCIASVAITVENPYYLGFQVDARPATCGSNNGRITITGNGNALPLLYSIDATHYQASGQFDNLPAGLYNAYVKDNNGCMVQMGVVLKNGCITVEATAKEATCGKANGNIAVTASEGTPPYQYALNGTAFQPSSQFSALVPASYTVTVKDAAGSVATKTVTVGYREGPQLAITGSTATDCSNTSGRLQVESTGGSLPVHYSIDGVNFATATTFNGLSSGSYTIVARDAMGCQATATASIALENTLKVAAGAGTTICEGSSTQLQGSTNGTALQWTPADGLSNPAAPQPTASPRTTTTYTLTASSGACTGNSTVTVTVNPAPVAAAGPDTTICQGKNARLQAKEGANSYSWSPALYLDQPDAPDPLVQYPPVGLHTYLLHVRDARGCPSLIPARVTVRVTDVKIFAGNDTAVAIGQPLQLSVTDLANIGLATYSWTPSQGLDDARNQHPVAVLNRDATYEVSARTAEGCEGRDRITIRVYTGPQVFVPTAFTPNGDGHNDVVKALPVGLKAFTRFTLYNRWGQVVFATSDAARGWNGTVNGVLQTGTFAWIAEGVDYKGKPLLRKGTVTVLP